MEEIKLSDDVIEQITDFNHLILTKEQKLLIDKLILNEELKERYKKYGLCKECNQPNTGLFNTDLFDNWCQSCYAKRFQQNFKNWTSGNHDIDEFIQNAQLRAKNYLEVLEWVEYDKFENIEYLAKGGFGTTYKANWKGGNIIGLNYKNNQWYRWGEMDITLIYLHNPQNITVEFLREVKLLIFTTNYLDRYYGITKDPETNKFMIVVAYSCGLCYECRKPYGYDTWCQSCNAKRFQQNFKNWTSGSHDIDEFIQNAQLNAKNNEEVLEWVEYNGFENIEYLAKGGFGTTYKANWKGGNIVGWNYKNNQWDRRRKRNVALKCLHNSQNITGEFLREIFTTNYLDHYYGITKDPETNNFMMVIDFMRDLCYECMKPHGYDTWCQSCNAKRFQQNFKNWTSGNHDIDEFIQNAQLRAKNYLEVLEWVEYDKFENIEYLAKGGFGTTYKAIWKDGCIVGWNYKNNQWNRWGERNIALKCFHNSKNITVEFLKEIFTTNYSVRYYGITKDPETNKFMMVMDYRNDLCYECVNSYADFDNWSHQLCQSCNAKRFQQIFKNWTSGNHGVDKFIQNAQLKAKNYKEVLEWIEYDKFKNTEYLAKGGFGTTYKAIWKGGNIVRWNYKNDQWNRWGERNIALKCLHNSKNITVEFLKEIESHLLTNNSNYVVRCYGVTKDPETDNFMMVMDYVDNNLRQHLNNNFNSLVWKAKLDMLWRIARGLNNIHDYRLIHNDFHCGNILNNFGGLVYITDLGLCKPANVKTSQSDSKKIYGVLPYVAPEVLRGKEYTQASDIYGFGIIAYEVCTGLPPYYNIAHDEFLAIRICHGLRPKSNYKIPQLILNIIKQCWDANPLNRPEAKELIDLITDLDNKSNVGNDEILNKQIKEADESNKQLSSLTVSSSGVLSYITHPQSFYTSRLLEFKNLPEPKNADYNDNSLEPEYSDSTAIDFTKLKRPNSKDESSETNKKRKITG